MSGICNPFCNYPIMKLKRKQECKTEGLCTLRKNQPFCYNNRQKQDGKTDSRKLMG